jgi:hypothetical protein
MAPPKPIPLPLVGGVDRLHDARAVGDGNSVRSKNIVPTESGMAAKRKAMDVIADYTILGFGNNEIVACTLLIPPAVFSSGIVLAGRRNDVFGNFTKAFVIPDPAVAAAVAQVDWDRASPARPLILFTGRKMYAFAGWNNLIVSSTAEATPVGPAGSLGIVFQETVPDGPLEAVRFVFYANAAHTISTEINAAPAMAFNYRNRVVWGNFGPGLVNRMVMSDPQDPLLCGGDFLSANGRAFDVGAHDGDRLVAGREIMLTGVGSPTDLAALVLREFSAYLLTGEPNYVIDGAIDQQDFRVNRINLDCGCSSAETLTNTPYGLFWAAWNEVWFFPQGSGIPIPVGTFIRKVLMQTPADKRYLWHASYFDGFYRLHLFSEGAGPDDYTMPDEEWRLDLRDGAPRSPAEARWYGPHVYLTPNDFASNSVFPGVAFQVADTRPGREPQLLGVTSISGGFSFLVQFEQDDVRDFDSGVPIITSIFGDARLINTEITVDWLSKEYDLGDPMVDKGYYGAEINQWVSLPCRATFNDAIEGGKVSASTTLDAPNYGFNMGDNDLDTTLLTREFQSLRFEVDQATRPTGKVHQFRLTDSAGYVITGANQLLSFTHTGIPFIATVPTGFYAHKGALLDAVVAAMLAISGITFTHNQSGAGLSSAVAITAASGTWTYSLTYRALLALMAYNTEAAPAVGATQTAGAVIFYREASKTLFGGLNVMLYPLRRRPT